MAEIGADPVTVRNSTPPSPTAPLRSLATSLRLETSKSSGTSAAPGLPPPPPTEVSDCAINSSPTAGRAGSGATIGRACALWYTSQRGQYHLVETMTILLVPEI